MRKYHIQAYAQVRLPDGSTTHTEDQENNDGFCVYVREEEVDEDGDVTDVFDILDEVDCATLEQAETEIEVLAKKYGLNPMDAEWY